MGPTGNSVAAVVVTYNRKDLLRECIGSLLSQEGAECDVLVFDNASTDGTAGMVESLGAFPRVMYFNTGDNLGGAGGFMCGIEAAVQMGYDYVWIMDDDSLPTPGALAELLRAGDELGDWGFLSSAVYWTDGSICQANRPKTTLFKHATPEQYFGGIHPIVMGSFVSMLVPTRLVKEIGLPIGEYFIWTDDYEYSSRISRTHPGYFISSSTVVHAMEENTRADFAKAAGNRIERFRILFRNDVNCYSKLGPSGWAYLAAKAAHAFVSVLLASPAGKGKKIRILATGYIDGFAFSPRIVLPADLRF